MWNSTLGGADNVSVLDNLFLTCLVPVLGTKTTQNDVFLGERRVGFVLGFPFVLRQDLTVEHRLAWNLPCCLGWL
jgi:hypothetical protein